MHRLARNKSAVASRKNFAEDMREMKQNLKTPKYKWKVLDHKKAKDSFPTIIKDDGDPVKSQRKITEIMATYFSKKVEDMKSTFDSDEEKAMTILK